MDDQTEPSVAKNTTAGASCDERALIEEEVQEAIRRGICEFPFGVRDMTPESRVSFRGFLEYVIKEGVPQFAQKTCERLLDQSIPDCIAYVYQRLEEEEDQNAFRCIFYRHHYGFVRPTEPQFHRFQEGIALLDFEQDFGHEMSPFLAHDGTPHMGFKINQTPAMEGTPNARNNHSQQHANTPPGYIIGGASDKDQESNSDADNEMYEVDGTYQPLLLMGEVKACFDIDTAAVPTDFIIIMPEVTYMGFGYVFLRKDCTIEVLRKCVVHQLKRFRCDVQSFDVFLTEADGDPMAEESFQNLRRSNLSEWKLTVRPTTS